jgi:hypothetical protein
MLPRDPIKKGRRNPSAQRRPAACIPVFQDGKPPWNTVKLELHREANSVTTDPVVAPEPYLLPTQEEGRDSFPQS